MSNSIQFDLIEWINRGRQENEWSTLNVNWAKYGMNWTAIYVYAMTRFIALNPLEFMIVTPVSWGSEFEHLLVPISLVAANHFDRNANEKGSIWLPSCRYTSLNDNLQMTTLSAQWVSIKGALLLGDSTILMFDLYDSTVSKSLV